MATAIELYFRNLDNQVVFKSRIGFLGILEEIEARRFRGDVRQKETAEIGQPSNAALVKSLPFCASAFSDLKRRRNRNDGVDEGCHRPNAWTAQRDTAFHGELT